MTGGSQCQDETQCYKDSVPFPQGELNKSVSVRKLFKTGVDADVKHCPCSTQGSGAKRMWEASLSSLKSKKVKGSHLVDCQLPSIWEVALGISRDGSCYQTCPVDASESKSLEGLPQNFFSSSCMEKTAEGCARGNTVSEASVREEINSRRECFKIILMNIADDNKKAHLEKVH